MIQSKKNPKVLAIHTEMVWLTYPFLKDLAKNIHLKLYVLTPVNYPYAVSFLGFRGSKEEYSKTLSSLYKELAKYAKVELHLHLSLFPEYLTYKEQYRMIEEAIKWGEHEMGIRFKEVVFGWWKYDYKTKDICEKLGLKIIKRDDYPQIHDYDLLYLLKSGPPRTILRKSFLRTNTIFLVLELITEQVKWLLFLKRNNKLKDYLCTTKYM